MKDMLSLTNIVLQTAHEKNICTEHNINILIFQKKTYTHFPLLTYLIKLPVLQYVCMTILLHVVRKMEHAAQKSKGCKFLAN